MMDAQFWTLTYAASTMWLHAPVLLLSVLGLGGRMAATFVLHRTLVNFGRNFVAMLSTSFGVELTPHAHSGNTAMIERGLTFVGRSVVAMAGRDGRRPADLRRLDCSIMDGKIGFVRCSDPVLAGPSGHCRGAGHILNLFRAARGYSQATGDRPSHQTMIAIALAAPLASGYGTVGVVIAYA